jgi:hypothetical protein
MCPEKDSPESISEGQAMSKAIRRKHPAEESEREERIINDIIVDTHGEEERAMGWYYYLQDKIVFPFSAVCDIERETSPLAEGDRVKALGMAGEEVCGREIFVRIAHAGKKGDMAVPLMQLVPSDDVDDDTREAIEDWRYWMNMGYDF